MRKQLCVNANITTTANVYMQPIPASVTAAMNSRARAVLSKKRQNSGKTSEAMHPVFHGRICKCVKRMAPQVGLEPTTLRLTAGIQVLVHATVHIQPQENIEF